MKKTLSKRFRLLIISLALFIAIVAVSAPVLAYYIRSSGKEETTYTPAEKASPSFTLNATESSVENVTISIPDRGYPVYVRAAIVITWLRRAECECTVTRCNTCPNPDCESCGEGETCEDCEDCKALKGCENCPNCSEEDCENCEGGCEDCLNCVVTCEDCEMCPNCDEDTPCETCENCTDCDGCQKFDECGVCKNCDNCIDREDCPRCNSDPDDDWDVYFAPITEGKEYELVTGSGAAGIWQARRNENDEKDDEFFYFSNPIQSSGKANPQRIITLSVPLIKSFILREIPFPPEEDIVMHVDVIVQTMQAIGRTDDDKDGDGLGEPAWQDAWGIDSMTP